MFRKALLIGSLVLLLLALLATTVVLAQGDATKGKATWAARNCKSCHGENGEGKYAGVRAGDGRAVADWIKQVRTPRAQMPAYSAAQLADADITDMWAFIQTQPKPASFTPITYTPAANDLPGKVLFNQKRCVACHGDGAAMIKTRFTDKGRAVTAEAVIAQLRKPAANMPAFAATQVSDAEATDIAKFLVTLAVPAALPKTGVSLISPALIAGFAVIALGATAGVAFLVRRRA